MAHRPEVGLRAWVYGAGKVGRALTKALRQHGATATLWAARKGLPRTVEADIVVLAVRDGDLGPLAEAMSKRRVVARHAIVVHVAGAFDAEPLAPLRTQCAGVAQMHPLLSFASTRFSPDLAGCSVLIQGDAAAVARARRLARLLGMKPWSIPGLDTALYHAAAGVVANGSAALAAVGAELLVRAGVTPSAAPTMLAPLLRSVADNVRALGFPGALTGPVRRGDAAAVQKHLATVRAKLPRVVALYLASLQAQRPLARAIGDASPANFDRVARLIRRESRRV